jgi:hypothetical protein
MHRVEQGGAAMGQKIAQQMQGGSSPDTIEAKPVPTEYARRLNDIWLEAEVRKAHDAFNKSAGPKLNQLGSAQTLQPPQSTGPGMPDVVAAAAAFKATMRRLCLEEHAVVTGSWQAIKLAQEQLFSDVSDALRKYYKAQAGWIRLIRDRDEYLVAYSMRDLNVLVNYNGLLVFEDGLRLGIALAIAGGGTGSIHQCPGDGAPPDRPPQEPDLKTPELAPPPPIPCPFKDHPLDLSGKLPLVDMVEAEFKLGCDAVSVGAGAGPFKASRRRVFKQRTETHYEVGVDKSVSGQGATLSVKATGTVDVVRHDDGRETVNTGVELQGKAEIWKVAEASITAGATSTYSSKPAKKPAKP